MVATQHRAPVPASPAIQAKANLRLKTALITGVSGQDGAYLARLLLEKGYRVVGTHRRSSRPSAGRLERLGIDKEVELFAMDVLEITNVIRTLEKYEPDEIYNLAAQSFVALSFEQPILTADIDALGPLRLLECLRSLGATTRFYQASTSEMFGRVQETPQTESTPFYPRSPYGVAKLFAHWATINYRESYGTRACSGILFNHESPLRGHEFVTRKITLGVSAIVRGDLQMIRLGNLDAKRDWGFAAEYVEAMWRMLQLNESEDFVIGTGETHTVREFATLAFATAGIDLDWRGEGTAEQGIDHTTSKVLVDVDPAFYRPAEVDVLQGNPAKAEEKLGWTPSTTFEELVTMMTEADLSGPYPI